VEVVFEIKKDRFCKSRFLFQVLKKKARQQYVAELTAGFKPKREALSFSFTEPSSLFGFGGSSYHLAFATFLETKKGKGS
jgi:hypothetical protein